MSMVRAAYFGVVVSMLAACGDDGGAGGATSATTGAAKSGSTSPSTGSGAGDDCVATFRWLQKDAYKETAGRSSDLWPPHTTTTLTVACRESANAAYVPVVVVVNANHGTEPSAVDANGTTILEEMKKEEAPGARATLLDLAEAMQTCACDPGTKFLSMDALGDAAVQELVGTVASYMQDNLVCSSPGGVEAVVDDLTMGEIDAVLAALPSCAWSGASSFAEGLDEALTAIATAAQETLAGYHVCNNDAVLQANLWAAFVATGTVGTCAETAAMECHGPAWFYAP